MSEQDDPHYRFNDQSYRFDILSEMLGRDRASIEDLPTHIPLVLLRTASGQLAVQVDRLEGHREIVAKPLSRQFSNITGISAATIMGDGRVVMILEIDALARHHRLSLASAKKRDIPEIAKGPARIMVVDDSITIRKVTERMLKKNNYDVVLAKDGLDAFNQINNGDIPDLMLLDIEMPRMDGFELAKNLMGSAATAHLPIVMITSRTGEKHKSRALGLGVKRYMGKPFSDVELLAAIEELLDAES